MPSPFITKRSGEGVLPAEGRVIENVYSGLLSLEAATMVFAKLPLISSQENTLDAVPMWKGGLR